MNPTMPCRLMCLKRALQKFPPLPRSPQRRRERNLIALKATKSRSDLNLPPLTYQKEIRDSYDNADDINKIFLKLSALHSKLPDSLKDILLQCACEDNRIDSPESPDSPADILINVERIHFSPTPDHVPLKKRIASNKTAKERKTFGAYRQDKPLATVVARWTPNSMSVKYDLKSVSRELEKFGDIESMTPFGRQTAIVVYKEICAASKAVNAFPPQGPERGMRCVWYHSLMTKFDRRLTFQKRKRIKGKR